MTCNMKHVCSTATTMKRTSVYLLIYFLYFNICRISYSAIDSHELLKCFIPPAFEVVDIIHLLNKPGRHQS